MKQAPLELVRGGLSPEAWVDVAERLPDDEVDVLTWRDDCQTVCYLRDGVWFLAGGLFANPPGYWRDLPEGPWSETLKAAEADAEARDKWAESYTDAP